MSARQEPQPAYLSGGDEAGPGTSLPDGAAYGALLRLANAHKRAVCDCENCPPGKAFSYDNCECGEDWSTCSGDVALLDAHMPNWRGQQW